MEALAGALCNTGAALTERIVVVSHNVGEGVGNISAGDNLLGLVRFVRELEGVSQVSRLHEQILTRRNEKIMQPKKSHFPIENGTGTQPLWASGGQLLKMEFDQESVDNMVIVVKISDT